MKGNLKKLVLALGVGLVLGSSAFAQSSSTFYRVVDAPRNQNGLIGERGTIEQLCAKAADKETDADPAWKTVSTGKGDIFNQALNLKWKEMYPHVTKQAALQCEVERTIKKDGTRKHTTVLPSMVVVW